MEVNFRTPFALRFNQLIHRLQQGMKKKVILVWDHFGPIHLDRLKAVNASLPQTHKMQAIEIGGKSTEYDWWNEQGDNDYKTLFPKLSLEKVSTLKLLIALISSTNPFQRSAFFLCHMERPAIFLFACWLRMTNNRVFAMGCSKFDDKTRNVFKEMLKSIFFVPYQGAIGSGQRGKEYFKFLGVPKGNIVGEYNTLSVTRIQRLSGSPPAPDGLPFEERNFICIARLIPKKNLSFLINSYAEFLKLHKEGKLRKLVLVGDGPERKQLTEQIETLRLQDHVVFKGVLQSRDVAKELSKAFALILPSYEEQFGNVVIEAQAMGLPTIISSNCGAADSLVQSGVNGFVFEANNSKGLAYFMSCISNDKALWMKLANEAQKNSHRGDSSRFAEGVLQLAT